MDNYLASSNPAISANPGYLFPLHTYKSFSAQRKQIRPEEKRKPIAINNQDFEAVDIQVVLEDVKNTHFNRFLADAVQYMEEHAPNELIQQALPYLYALNEKTTAYEALLDFPPLSVSLPEAGELLVELNFEHFAVGISFETDPEQSSWYTVNDGTVKKTTQWGYLSSQAISELMNKFVAQITE